MIRTDGNWKEIEENNKSIAEFLGYVYVPHSKDIDNHLQHAGWNMPNTLMIGKTSIGIGKPFLCRKHRDIEFHCNWEWLMHVVDKIEDLGSPVYIHSNSCTIYESVNFNVDRGEYYGEQVLSTKFESVYQAVVNYIHWYKKKKDYEKSKI